MLQSLLRRMARTLFQAASTRGRAPAVPPRRRQAALWVEALETRLTPSGTVLFVNENALGTDTGQSWANAYTDLQSALHVAKAGDEIWVAKGTYFPTQGTDLNATFTLPNEVGVYGGFAGNETQLSQRDWQDNLTVLSGFLHGVDPADGSYHVVTAAGDDPATILDGFTIDGGNADSFQTYYGDEGGGLLATSSPTLQNLNFEFNNALDNGGAVLINGNPALTNVTFEHNTVVGIPDTGGGGGAICFTAGHATITNAVFQDNSAPVASATGGAIYVYQANPTFTNVVFSGNSAQFGGAVECTYLAAPAIFTNVVFFGNSAQDGGAVECTESSQPTIFVNATFSGNNAVTGIYATLGGGAVECSGADATLTNSILWGDSSPIGPELSANYGSVIQTNFCDIQGGVTGANNLSVDPLFVSQATGDLRLQTDSPVIDVGTNIGAPAFDLLNNPRPSGAGTDMGAYEFQTHSTTTLVTTPAVVTFSTGSQLLQLTASVTAPRTVVNSSEVAFDLVNVNTGANFPVFGVPVSNGQASTILDTAGLGVGTYSIHAQFAADHDFDASADSNAGTLTINPDTTTTAVSSSFSLTEAGFFTAPATFMATVTPGDRSANGTVNEGYVAFTLLDVNNNVVATSADMPVSGGSATASFSAATMNALAPGTYYVAASYVPAPPLNFSSTRPDFLASSSFARFALTSYPIQSFFGAGPTTTTVLASLSVANDDTSAPFTLAAYVDSLGGPVTGGTVAFTVFNSSQTLVQTYSASVSGGYAAVSDVPTELAPGLYSIHATYTPAAGVATYSGSADTDDATVQLVGQPTLITFSPLPTNIVYSSNAQIVNVSATVAPSSAVGTLPVQTGVVTFTLFNASQQLVLSTATGHDTGGPFAAQFNLPAGFAAGTYSVQASYAPYNNSAFLASTATTDAALVVAPAPVTVVTPGAPLSIPFSPLGDLLMLSVQVQAAGLAQGPVINQGTVTFTGPGLGTTSASVIAGVATGTFLVPGGTAPGTYFITASYQSADPNYAAYVNLLQPDAYQALVIAKANQTFSFAAPTSPISFAPNQAVSLSATVGASGNPVSFSIDPTSTGTGSINGSTLTVTGAGTFVLDANEAGSTEYNAAPQLQQTLVVQPAGQTISFTAPAAPIPYAPNQTIALGAGALGGTVLFKIDPSSTGAGTISGSTLTVTRAGTIVVDATQAGNTSYTSASAQADFVIARAMPTVQVSDAGTTYSGAASPATATVAGIAGPAGPSLENVGLTLDYQLLGSNGKVVSDLGAVAPSAAGSYEVVASFAGSTDYTAASASTPFTIAPRPITVTVNANANPSSATYGSSLKYTATVTNTQTAAIPTGYVSFYANATPTSLGTYLGHAALSNGTATFTTTAVPAGSDTITAIYNVAGTGSFAKGTSTNTVVQTVTPAPTSTTVAAAASNPDAASYGQPLTLVATVTNTQTAALPTGYVSFYANATPTSLGTYLGHAALSNGTATFTTTAVPAGSDTITAIYNVARTGSFAKGTSTNTVAQTVTPAPTSITVAAAASNPNAASYGQPLTFVATVTNTQTAALPTGYVSFYANATPTSLGTYLGHAALSNGTATFTTTAVPAGSDTITAIYNVAGTGSFAKGTSTNTVVQTVTPAPTSTTVAAAASNPDAASYGQPLTLVATVTNTQTGALPTGYVSFYANATPTSLGTYLGHAALSNGTATFTTTAVPAGSDTITAIYNVAGTGSFAKGTSTNTVTQTVTPAPTSITVAAAASNPNAASYGQPLTLVATVTNTQTGALPTGYVSFYANATPTSLGTYLGHAALSNGTATFTTTAVPAGSDTITAIYNVAGTGSFAKGTSTNTVMLTVT